LDKYRYRGRGAFTRQSSTFSDCQNVGFFRKVQVDPTLLQLLLCREPFLSIGATMTLLKVREVAERLNCSPAHVYPLIESGRLKCHLIGNGKQGGKRVSEEQLAAFLKETESNPLPSVQETQPEPKLR